MKNIILLFVIYSFTTNQKKELIENFSLNNFSYNIYKEEKYLHDDNIQAEYFTVYLKNKKTALCSSFMSEKRNDTLFTKGIYLYTKKNIVFKEYYYHHQNERVIDSMIKTYYPSKNGNLILKGVVKFKNGKVIKV